MTRTGSESGQPTTAGPCLMPRNNVQQPKCRWPSMPALEGTEKHFGTCIVTLYKSGRYKGKLHVTFKHSNAVMDKAQRRAERMTSKISSSIPMITRALPVSKQPAAVVGRWKHTQSQQQNPQCDIDTRWLQEDGAQLLHNSALVILYRRARLSEGALHERYYLLLGIFIMLQIVNNFPQVVVSFKAEQSWAGLDGPARLLNAHLQQILKQRLQSFL